MDNIEVYGVYAVGIPVITLMIALEAAYSAWHQKGLYEARDSMGSFTMFVGNVMIQALIGGLAVAVYFFMYEHRLFNLTEILPNWLIWALVFIALDFVFYWYHRLSHRTSFLWSIHLSHHCSTEMNFLVALRQPWLAPIVKIPFFAFIPLFGFDPTIIFVAAPIATIWGVVGHTKTIPRLPEPIEYIFNTPSAHRVHHGSNPQYIDKNYGNLLMIWDHIFGTYQKEEEEVVYGIGVNVETQNPIALTFKPCADLIRNVSNAHSFREGVRVLLRPPA